MSSNRNWLQVNTTTNNLSSTLFNNSYSMSFENVMKLADEIILPNFVQGLFTKPEDWISTLIYYPLKLNSGEIERLAFGSYNEGNIFGYKMLNSYCWYNLGQWYCRHKGDYPTFADFSGFTKIEVFLPYVGYIELSPNDVMNKWVQFRLKVDIHSGTAVYYICVSNSSMPSTSVFVEEDEDIRILSTHSTQIGIQIPIGTTNTTEIYRNLALGAVKAISGIAGSAISYSMGVGLSTSKQTTTKTVSGGYDRFSPITHRPMKRGTWDRSEATTSERTYDNQSYLKGRAVSEVFSAGEQAISAMHSTANSDKVNNPALLANASSSIKIVVKRPIYKDMGYGYGELYGYPCGEVLDLSTVSGYTEITEVHIEGEAFEQATQSELAQLQDELLNGVIL